MMAFKLFEGKEPFTDFFTQWSRESFSMMSGGLNMFDRINRAWLEMADNTLYKAPTVPDPFQNFSKGWLEGYSRMYRTWMESVQKIGETCRSGIQEKDQPDRILKACGEISQNFTGEWLSFVSEQSKSFMQLRESCFPAEKTEPVKGKRDGGRE